MAGSETIQFARRQRHVHLLRKVRSGKSLSAAELAELERYERHAESRAIGEGGSMEAAEIPEPGPRPKRRPLSAVRLRALAAEVDSLAEASARVGKDLGPALAVFDDLRAAWAEGCFLRDLGRLAAAAATIEEAAGLLGMESEALSKRLEADPVAADTWNRARLRTAVELKQALHGKAMDGNARAISMIEANLRAAVVRRTADVAALPMRTLAVLAGKSHTTVYKWRDAGMPRNADGTVDLARFLPWYERFLTARVGDQLATERPNDPLRAVKARKLQMELEQLRGALVSRAEFIEALAGRAVALAGALGQLPGRLASRCHAQSKAQIERIVAHEAAQVRRAACEVPAVLQLDPAQEQRLERLLRVLARGGEEPPDEEAL